MFLSLWHSNCVVIRSGKGEGGRRKRALVTLLGHRTCVLLATCLHVSKAGVPVYFILIHNNRSGRIVVKEEVNRLFFLSIAG